MTDHFNTLSSYAYTTESQRNFVLSGTEGENMLFCSPNISLMQKSPAEIQPNEYLQTNQLETETTPRGTESEEEKEVTKITKTMENLRAKMSKRRQKEISNAKIVNKRFKKRKIQDYEHKYLTHKPKNALQEMHK